MTQKLAENFQILMPEEFLEDVRSEAEHAKHRVWMQAMDVEPDAKVNTLLNLLFAAAEKKLDARLHADYFSLLITDGKFNYLPIFNKQERNTRDIRLEKKKTFFHDLKNAGVGVLFTNPPTFLDRIFPARGRNHMKIVIIDNAAWIGGINFHDKNINIFDSMVKLTNISLVNEIAEIFIKTDREVPFDDMEIRCLDDTSLLVDGGSIARSIILDHAIDSTRNAKKSIKLISPLIPDTKFLRTLHDKQKEGIEVAMIAPQIQKMSGIFAWVDILNDITMILKRYTIPILFKPFMIHAKVLIVDDEKVIYGSHNFSKRGVMMGTEEIALESTNKILVTNILKFYQKVLEL